MSMKRRGVKLTANKQLMNESLFSGKKSILLGKMDLLIFNRSLLKLSSHGVNLELSLWRKKEFG